MPALRGNVRPSAAGQKTTIHRRLGHDLLNSIASSPCNHPNAQWTHVAELYQARLLLANIRVKPFQCNKSARIIKLKTFATAIYGVKALVEEFPISESTFTFNQGPDIPALSVPVPR